MARILDSAWWAATAIAVLAGCGSGGDRADLGVIGHESSTTSTSAAEPSIPDTPQQDATIEVVPPSGYVFEHEQSPETERGNRVVIRYYYRTQDGSDSPDAPLTTDSFVVNIAYIGEDGLVVPPPESGWTATESELEGSGMSAYSGNDNPGQGVMVVRPMGEWRVQVISSALSIDDLAEVAGQVTIQ